MKCRVVLLCVLLSAAPLIPSEGGVIDMFGYWEPQYMGADISGDYHNVVTNKLRLDTVIEYSETLSFGANCNLLFYNGRTTWNLLDFIPVSVSRDIAGQDRVYYEFDYENDIILDNAFMKIALKQADIIIGRQQISPGTGYAWNPTDIFNRKEMADPTYEQPGHNALRLEIPFEARTTLIMIYETDDDFEDSAKLVRMKTGYGRFDYSLIFISSEREVIDFTDFSSLKQERLMAGVDLAGELLGLGTWCEYAYNFTDKGADSAETVVGLDYTYTNGIYIMGEYYRNTEGETDHTEYDINTWMRFLTAQTKVVCRDQVYAMASFPLTDFITPATAAIISLNDSSLSLMPSMNYSMLENLELQLIINVACGKAGTVFDSNLGSGAIFRMKLYF